MFSSLVAELTGPVGIRSAVEVLDQVAVEFPELDKAKYGEMPRTYGRALLKRPPTSQLLRPFAGQRTLLSAEKVRKCDVDRDVVFEARLGLVIEELKDAPLSPDVEVEEEEEEETATPGHKDVNAEEQHKSSEVERVESSGGNKLETDLTPYLDEIKHLSRLVDLKDGEIGRCHERMKNVQVEYEAKYQGMQIKCDSLHARYIRKKDELDEAEVKVAEHTKYERMIHELGEATITEVEAEALQVSKRCARE